MVMKKRPKLRSIWVFHLNTGACNGCDIEILDVLTPYYDVERFGVKLVGTPRHADVLLVTGPLTRQSYYAVKRTYEAMPLSPRIVVAIGTCACSGGIFYDSYAVHGGIDKLLPVHMYIPGCPPRPEEIIYGVAQLVGLVEKHVRMEYAREDSIGFVLPKYPVSERIRLDLRDLLNKVVGYFDRDKILEDFLKLVEEAKKARDERARLRELIEEYCKKARDPRLCFCINLLEKEYWRLRELYEKKMVPPKIIPY